MKLIVLGAGGPFVFIVILLWMMTRLQYRIGGQHLRILFFGVTLRKIPLSDIKRISKRRPGGTAEYWYNTLKPSHRLLSIQRNSGLRKYIVISPRNRYIFLADLQNAVQRLKPETPVGSLVDQTPEEAEP
jgi:hypothetical protein